MDYRDKIKRATEQFVKRETSAQGPKRNNKKPEKEVEKQVLVWLKQNNFCCDVVEAKATFSVASNRYTGRAASPGMSDIIGNTSNGLAVFIELKAPGRRVGSALREDQRAFLTRKIQSGCFAVVADSAEYIDRVWKHYLTLSQEEKISYLLNEIPKHNPRQDEFPW